ncbi:MAG TPA: hypothetical protein VF517_11130 [Thermoleophilaceae bacterium]|jgi:hypothetical protein
MTRVPEPVARATASVFRTLSSLRGKRAFHPHGLVFEAEFEPYLRSSPTGVEILDGGPRRALVRCSRALGFPEPAPDILGFAIRFTDAYGAGRHQDLLCVTSIDAPVGHHALIPATGFFTRPYSTLLAYRLPEGVRLFGVLPIGSGPALGPRLEQIAEAARRGTATFELALAPLSGRFDGVGTIQLGDQLPPEQGELLRFNPWNSGGGMCPTGPFMGLRDAAYKGSQEGAAT